MVSLWPWKGDDTSPASFEKSLSSLSAKITNTTTSLDSLRQRSRRLKALWTLYSIFAYLLYAIILALVVGWKSWGPVEYTVVAGGPLIIYMVRFGLTSYYEYRTSTYQRRLNGLQKQRDTVIDKLKTATKYNTTQQLLEKYGGTPSKTKSTVPSTRKPTPSQGGTNASKRGRGSFVPPPTANVPRGTVGASLPNTPLRSTSSSSSLSHTPPFSAAAATAPWQSPPSPASSTAEFAPNAFSSAPQYAQVTDGSKWYDRLMDVLLGEDETLPKNRLALICKQCRLVNGQAPPGAKSLHDVGKWRCSGCGAMNGEESEAKKIVAEMQERAVSGSKPASARSTTVPTPEVDGPDDEVVLVSNENDHESDITQYSEDELNATEMKENQKELTPDPEPPRPKRGRPKGNVKNKS